MQGPLTYQEILRTLGTLLDQSGSATASITLSPESAEVQAPSWPWQHTWSRDALYLESDRQRSWRYQPRPAHMAKPGRFNNSLRVIGAALDTQGGGPYTVVVEAEAVRVRAPDGSEQVFDAKSLERRVKLAEHLRGQLPAR
jgi:hypothetical protein